MLGGLAFVAAMLFLQKSPGTLSLEAVNILAAHPFENPVTIMLPLAFLTFAAFTKAARLPFQSWLCGAMVAPKPVSALLHSSIMVKAGVYLVLRIAPPLAGTMLAGILLIIFHAVSKGLPFMAVARWSSTSARGTLNPCAVYTASCPARR